MTQNGERAPSSNHSRSVMSMEEERVKLLQEMSMALRRAAQALLGRAAKGNKWAKEARAKLSDQAGQEYFREELVRGGEVVRRRVGTWLGGTAAWTLSMVVIGGVTRLTGSGLSMTSWKPAFERFPRGEQEWREEFERYKETPEYRLYNQGIDLKGFKTIYWIEYAHRAWGRALGAFFFIPGAYFAYKGYLTRRLFSRCLFFLSLGASQGFLGWWMVRSGLQEDTPIQGRVSPYRLASHLTAAATIYGGLVWTALDVARPFPVSVAQETLRANMRLRKMLIPFAAIAGLTAISGSFVAGLDAGRAYNDLLSTDIFGDYGESSTAMWQLNHRLLASLTTLKAIATWRLAARMPVSAGAKWWANAIAATTAVQFTLGVEALLNYVPVSLGVAHQAGAFALFTFCLCALHHLRP